MEDQVTFKGPANQWKKTFGINKLLNNVNGIYFMMAQGSQKGDAPDGTKSKYRNIEIRVFNSKEDAEYFVKHIYRKINYYE